MSMSAPACRAKAIHAPSGDQEGLEIPALRAAQEVIVEGLALARADIVQRGGHEQIPEVAATLVHDGTSSSSRARSFRRAR